MPDKDQFDILIIGSGEAGKYLAWTMAKTGRRTAVVERGLIGGSCPNIACLPSKNVIHSAKVAELARRAGEFGVATGPVTIDMAAVRARKRQMIDGLINLHLDRYKASGAELILGEARFVAPSSPCQNFDFPERRNLGGFGRTPLVTDDLIGEFS
jgi:pyruvate/2-oxoglutarate dehydrogenase complex dihydrolipoamide dehydrogenase (E3) component